MITCVLRGVLGNQLFQIFATIAYAQEYKYSFGFLQQETHGGNGSIKRVTYWENFLKPLKFFLFKTMPTVILPLKEEGFHYNSLPIPPYVENISLIGYFQSYKYFEKHYETICRLIKLNEQRDKYSNESNKNAISMHFRLGDYKKLGHLYPIMNVEYYKNALETNVHFSKVVLSHNIQCLITECLDANPSKRPDINEFINRITCVL